jgi:hypothetical protein
MGMGQFKLSFIKNFLDFWCGPIPDFALCTSASTHFGSASVFFSIWKSKFENILGQMM